MLIIFNPVSKMLLFSNNYINNNQAKNLLFLNYQVANIYMKEYYSLSAC